VLDLRSSPLLALCAALTFAPAQAAVVNDVTQLNPIPVDRVVAPRTVAEVRRLVKEHAGPISIGGGRFSMGGQIATDGALFLDMRGMDHVLAFDPKERTIVVESGITWRKIQEKIDPAGLSLKIMQSYANFTVGGSLSVDCHGRYVNQGPLVMSVRALSVVLADGRLIEASRTKNPEIFFGAIGGYGGLGVIVTATLDLAENVRVERVSSRMPVSEYRRWFFSEIKGSTVAVFHNADIYPPEYREVNAVTYLRTDLPVTVPDRLIPTNLSYRLDRFVYWVISLGDFGKWVRRNVVDPRRMNGRLVEWRNYEASDNVAELEPASRKDSTYVLQEYFVPVERFDEFVPKMGEIFNRYHVDVMNVSIRHAGRDPGTLLAWARHECFAFVVYYKQGTTPAKRDEVGIWTREMIDAALSVGGAYYLPYQILATDAQFRAAYPRAGEFFALKKKLDPDYKFRNRLWDRYLPPPADARAKSDAAIRRELRARPSWRRAEEQTFLTLPEWYIVYSADEYAGFLKSGLPSGFPYFASVRQFWARYSSVRAALRGIYPSNWGYQVMIVTIGASFTAQYAAKGAWEQTLGRFTEKISLDGDPGRAGFADRHMAGAARDYASFIHDYPWYEFGFASSLRAFERASDPGPWTLRRLERDAAVPLELGAQAVWGKVIKKATGTAYAPEDYAIEAWVRPGGTDPEKAYPGIKVLKKFEGGDRLVSIPRYESFKRASLALAANKIRFIEIAGNGRILVTVVAPTGWDGGPLYGDVVDEWPLLTDASRKRVALSVPVAELTAALRGLPAEKAEIDHVYDY
jgi:FAD/FMN-containing dehydrogenase